MDNEVEKAKDRVRNALNALPGRTVREAELTDHIYEPLGAYYHALRITFTDGEPLVLFSWDQESYASGLDTQDLHADKVAAMRER